VIGGLLCRPAEVVSETRADMRADQRAEHTDAEEWAELLFAGGCAASALQRDVLAAGG